jgi:glycosyltransferase involved in cell wall biosynthesis
MKLILNNASTFKGGAEQVALSFISECRKFPEHEYHVVVCENLATQIDQQEYPGNFTFHILDKRPAASWINFYKKMLWYQRLASEVDPDCIVSTGGHGYWTPKRIPVVAGFNMAHFVYPESPYFKIISAKRRIWWRVRSYLEFYLSGRTDALFVQTDDVKERLLSRLKGCKVYTISNTVHPAFTTEGGNGEECFLGVRDRRSRLLTVSAYYPHKNLDVIPAVLDHLQDQGRDDFVFVVTLRDEDYQRLFAEKYHERILNVGPVPISRAPGLYRECDFMFLPTLLECFSASYAEAMAMNKPIITSDMDFAHTVCKDAALYFDPLDPIQIAETIIRLKESPEQQAVLVSSGAERLKTFGDSYRRAKQILQICGEAVMQNKTI